ncbi:hypothetical protein CLAVI_000988 [Candidatus Clavichlamydia salmonicola]|uniref:hypothetical protein n=1 Tax=Candidatus Clavichlamydia salmonicola TaxID=469812 RepID=UPI001891AF97|nr:hypothetical protein [Candidatus Clavichlamydia salmonicola]MBF5051345.1 hypothetical protein [Candidatus Clavichlamydia salmonicola]
MYSNDVMQNMQVLEESIGLEDIQGWDCIRFDEVEKLDPDLPVIDSMFSIYFYENILRKNSCVLTYYVNNKGLLMIL